MNGMVQPILNPFFIGVTALGDGLFTLVVVLILAFFSLRSSFAALLGYLLSASLAQTLKYLFFDKVERPALRFEELHLPLQLVWDDNLIHHSFPSGHATAAFSLFFILAFLAKNNYQKAFCFYLSVLIAFSRVYLSQHFFEDVVAGSAIGIVCAWLSIYFIYFSSSQNRFSILNKPLYSFKK